MMKRFLIGLGIVVLAIFGAVTLNTEAENTDNIVKVVEENGFQVLDIGNKKGFSTIAVEVTDNDSDGDGYVIAVNLFDNNDEVALEKGDLKAGDIVLVTFKHDDVAKVEKNTLNINNIVVGQKIIN